MYRGPNRRSGVAAGRFRRIEIEDVGLWLDRYALLRSIFVPRAMN
jgi:hypothetical protein